jgi:2',3'-cyclic-nucleotide 2'-phosphodiesterase (5'-nucleotidase family)
LDFSYTLNSTNVVTYENQISPAKGSFFYQNLHYSVTKADPATTDWISLSQGGVFTNLDPLIGHYKTINVTFTRLSEFGSLLVKASPYAVTSPANAAYEIVSGQSFTFPSSGAYFSLYAAVGSFKIENVSFACSPETIAPQEPSALDFYSINDTHGAAEEVVDTYHAGITRLSSAYRQMQFANPEGAILLSSGDMWQGSADSNLTHGELMVNWMNLIGFESMAIGNHEFDWGTPYIESNLKVANFPFLGINIVDGNNERPAWAKPSVVLTRAGIKIGVIGAIGKLEGSIAVSSLGKYSFRSDYSDLAEAEAQRLRKEEGCSLVVVSVHNDSFDTTSCPDIDAVFEGHSHQSYALKDAQGIPHVQAYANGGNIRHVRFAKANGKWAFDSYDSIDFSAISTLNEEPATLALYNAYLSKIEVIKNQVIGHSDNGYSKLEIAQLAAKALYYYYKNDAYSSELMMGVVNNGGARTSIPAGDITYGQVYAALPFDNDNVLCTTTGAFLKEMAADTGNLATFSEASVTALEDAKTYYVDVISYISEKVYYAAFLKEVKRDSYYLRNIVADYLGSHPNV